MPIRRRKAPVLPAESRELLSRLVSEWRAPSDDPQAPVIVEEGGQGGRPIHLYVIWNDWGGLTLRERSEIIMDAYKEVKGDQAVLNVSVAMGLKAEEAKRMGIEYE